MTVNHFLLVTLSLSLSLSSITKIKFNKPGASSDLLTAEVKQRTFTSTEVLKYYIPHPSRRQSGSHAFGKQCQSVSPFHPFPAFYALCNCTKTHVLGLFSNEQFKNIPHIGTVNQTKVDEGSIKIT